MKNKKLIILLCIIAVITFAVGVAFVGCALPNNGDPDNGNGDNGYINGGGSGGGTGGGDMPLSEQLRIARETLYNIERAMDSPFISNEAAGAAIGFSAVTEPATPATATESRWGWLEEWMLENDVYLDDSARYRITQELVFLLFVNTTLQLMDQVGEQAFNYKFEVDIEGNIHELDSLYLIPDEIPRAISVLGVDEHGVLYVIIDTALETVLFERIAFTTRIWHNSDDDFGFEMMFLSQEGRPYFGADSYVYFNNISGQYIILTLSQNDVIVDVDGTIENRGTYVIVQLRGDVALLVVGNPENAPRLRDTYSEIFDSISKNAERLDTQNNDGNPRTVSTVRPNFIVNIQMG